jgi:hypothetical protein
MDEKLGHMKRKFRSRMFENRPLNRTFGPKNDELGGVGEN